MGTCISKSRPNPSPTKQPSPPQDKLIISQSPCIGSSVRIARGHQHSSSTSSSSSSYSSSSSTTSTSSSICSSSSKDGNQRNESPWASVRQHPHIIVLDPGNCKQSPLRSNPVKFSDQAPGTFAKTIADAPRKSQPPKRARSTSPALVRRKSFRSIHEQSSAVPTRCQRQSSPCRPTQARQPTETHLRTPSLVSHRSNGREFQQNTVAFGSRNLASPSPGRRFGVGAGGGHAKCAREELPRRELETGDNRPRACPVATRKEGLPNSSSPCGSGLHAPPSKRRETSVHPIRAPVEQGEVAEIIFDQDCGFSHVEDMNNPLIALDCFIFL